MLATLSRLGFGPPCRTHSFVHKATIPTGCAWWPPLFAAKPARHAALRLGGGILDRLVKGIDGLVHLRTRVLAVRLGLLGRIGRRLTGTVVLVLCLGHGRVDLGAGLGGVLFGLDTTLVGVAAGAVAGGPEVV